MEWWLPFEPVTKGGLSLLGSPCQTEDGAPGIFVLGSAKFSV